MSREPPEGPPPPGTGERLRRSFRNHMPERDALSQHPLLRPIARHLLSPALWHLQHESVARGVAIGLFWAFAMPIGQIPIAAAHCIWWRGNVAVSVASTFITNPLTLGFWLWLAYETGTLFIDAPPLVMPGQGTPLAQWLQNVGLPVVLGMGLFALGGSVGGYLLVKLGWRVRVALKRRRRTAAKTRQSRHD